MLTISARGLLRRCAPSTVCSPRLAGTVRRGAARSAVLRPRTPDRGQLAGGADGRALRRAWCPRVDIQAARLDFGRVVLTGRGARHRDPVLPRASAPDEARESSDARGRRGYPRVVHADSPARGRARVRQRLRTETPQAPQENLRPAVSPVS